MKNPGRATDAGSSCIENSNEFSRMVTEIANHESSPLNQKRAKQADSEEFAQQLCKPRMESTKTFEAEKRKTRKGGSKKGRKGKQSIDPTPIFPHITSLILKEREGQNCVPSSDIKSIELNKIKHRNSLKKFNDSYNFQTYESIREYVPSRKDGADHRGRNKECGSGQTNRREPGSSQYAQRGSEPNATFESNCPYGSEKPKGPGRTELNSYGTSEMGSEINEPTYVNKVRNPYYDESDERSSNGNTEDLENSEEVQTSHGAGGSNRKGNRRVVDKEKENVYLKTPFVTTIECLDEKSPQQHSHLSKSRKTRKGNEGKDDDSSTCGGSKKGTKKPKELGDVTSYEQLEDRHPSAATYRKNTDRDGKISKRSMGETKQFFSVRSNLTAVTTTDTDSFCSIRDDMNMSYEDYKQQNKKRMCYLIEQEKNKNALLDVLNSEPMIKLRKRLRIMRELYIGFIGIQLIFFIASVLLGTSNIYLIQVFSLSCTIFSILDANFHGYILNGFIFVSISILFSLASAQAISGFEVLKSTPVFMNIMISYISLSVLFSVFSFVNGFYIYQLHSTEKRCIKEVVNNIEEDTQMKSARTKSVF